MQASADRRAFAWKKLHSLSGVVPLGVFLVGHLWMAAALTGGPEHFEQTVAQWHASMHHVVLLGLVQLVFVWAPLLFHAGYGFVLWRRGRTNALQHGTFRNWLVTLQRWTGLVLLIFVAYHTWGVWRVVLLHWGGAVAGPHPGDGQIIGLTALMVDHLAGSYFVRVLYIAGIFSAALHLAHGLWSFAVDWGITPGRRAMQASTVVCAVLFAVLFLLGMQALTELVQLGA